MCQAYVVGSKSFRPDQLFKVNRNKTTLLFFNIVSLYFNTLFTSVNQLTQMALYIPHSIFHLARLLYVTPETFGPYYVYTLTERPRRAELLYYSFI